MAYSPNVEAFLDRYENEPALYEKVQNAIASWPGSLECREYLVQDVLLPIAAEEGLPFELADLRKYETHRKITRHADVEIDPEEPDDDYIYWLVDTGWGNDESIFER